MSARWSIGQLSTAGDPFAIAPPSLLFVVVVMYVYQGRQVGYHRDAEELHAIDIQLHRHWLTKREVGGNDRWTPNEMMKKRDFQEINPPQTMTEFYARYDPSIGWGTAIALSSFMVLMLANVTVKWMARRCRRLRHKWFCKEQLGGGGAVAEAVNDMHFGITDDLAETTPSVSSKRLVQSYSDSTCLTSLATTTLLASERETKPYVERTMPRPTDGGEADAVIFAPVPLCGDQLYAIGDDESSLRRSSDSTQPSPTSSSVVVLAPRRTAANDVETVLTTTATIEYQPEVVNNGRSRPNGGPAASALKAFGEQMEESAL
uniref:Transmembrane protein n=1 Tax=Plectus sambesii TaxID=2011161 RepID=A0A914UM21_9BILA